MIVTELYNGQGLGNQLWVYVVARILAEKQKTSFSIKGAEQFKGRDFMLIDFGSQFEPTTTYYKERVEFLYGTDIDISRTDQSLLTIGPSTTFDGNCQSTKYLDGYREHILSWIKMQDTYSSHIPDKNTCIIHLRFGDFENQKDVFLPSSYYIHAMDYVRTINSTIVFKIVTDEKEKAENFLPGIEIIGSSQMGISDTSKAPHHLGGPLGIDFTILTNASYLIIPNSSFSWWAAYLNTKKQVAIAPKYWARHNISDGYWSTSDIITDDLLYIDRGGKTYSATECWEEKNTYETSHPHMFATAPYRSISARLKGLLREIFNIK